MYNKYCSINFVSHFQLSTLVRIELKSFLWNLVRKMSKTVISISRNALLKSCARFIIERSEIRKKQHDFKSVHFECRMVLFYTIWEKSRL